MPKSDAQRAASKRYYEKNRAILMEKMRSQYAARAADAESRRIAWNDSYSKRTLTKKERILRDWMATKSGVVRSFLRDYVFPNREMLPMAFFKMLEDAIADNPEQINLAPPIDGRPESEAPEGEEGEEGEESNPGVQDYTSDQGSAYQSVV